MSTLASVQMSVTYKLSKSSPEAPCSYLSVSVAVKDIKNILVMKLTDFGDNLKSLSNNIEEKSILSYIIRGTPDYHQNLLIL